MAVGTSSDFDLSPPIFLFFNIFYLIRRNHQIDPLLGRSKIYSLKLIPYLGEICEVF